jgi:hypothetical protein
VAIRAPRHFVKTGETAGRFAAFSLGGSFAFFGMNEMRASGPLFWVSGTGGEQSGAQGVPSALRLSRAAAIVASISGSVWAADTNRASYCEGGKKNPRRSIS